MTARSNGDNKQQKQQEKNTSWTDTRTTNNDNSKQQQQVITIQHEKNYSNNDKGYDNSGTTREVNCTAAMLQEQLTIKIILKKEFKLKYKRYWKYFNCKVLYIYVSIELSN